MLAELLVICTYPAPAMLKAIIFAAFAGCQSCGSAVQGTTGGVELSAQSRTLRPVASDTTSAPIHRTARGAPPRCEDYELERNGHRPFFPGARHLTPDI